MKGLHFSLLKLRLDFNIQRVMKLVPVSSSVRPASPELEVVRQSYPVSLPSLQFENMVNICE